MGVQIIEGVLSSDHIHMFVSVPPHIAISDLNAARQGAFFLQNPDGVSGNPQALLGPEILGYFCTTSGNVTDDIILQYIQSHSDKPTDASR